MECVVPSGQCPANCQAGYTCSASTNFVCQLIAAPAVVVTSPGANAFSGSNLQVTATAVAPGGTTGVLFQVLRAGAVLGAVPGVKRPTAADPNNYAGRVPLTGSGDGPATVIAIETWNDASENGKAATTMSPAVPVVIDLTPPVLTLGTDGTQSFLGPGNSPALITVKATDIGGSGVAASGLSLTLTDSNHAPYAGMDAGTNQFAFSVPFADIATSGAVAYSVSATDAAGNVTTVGGDGREVIQVDATAPTGTLTADQSWHAANERVMITGAAADTQSGLAGVTLTAGTETVVGTITGNTYSVAADLATQSFPADENSVFPIAVKVSDRVGNVLTLNWNLLVDNKPPTIGTPLVPAGDSGTTFFAAAGPDIAVTTTVLDSGAGLKDGTVSMQYQVGAGAPHPLAGSKGATLDGTETWTFTVPRSLAATACGTSPCDGSAPLVLKALAQDNVLNQGASVTSALFFDAAPPVVSIASDATWYAASQVAPIAVGLTMTDSGSGVDFTSVAFTDGSGATYPRVGDPQCTASPCSVGILASDFAQAVGGTEGTLSLALSVKDKFGNIGTATGTRSIDGKPPTVTITSIYATGAAPGLSSIVTYPSPFPAAPTRFRSGYDGSHFLLGDSVHVTATVSDGGSGVKASGFQVRLDGISDGLSTIGTPVTVTTTANSCADGSATCNIEFDVLLNAQLDPGNGLGGNLGLVVLAKDVTGNTGTSIVTAVAATRLWWSQVVSPQGYAVNGLAVHPNGSIIATVDTDTASTNNDDGVFALFSNGPFNAGTSTNCAAGPIVGVEWCVGHDFYGSGSRLGMVPGAPVIGDNADSQLIYLATEGGDVVALTGSGAKKWGCGQNAFGNASATPAVGTSGIGLQASCEAVFYLDGELLWGVCNPSGALCRSTSVATSDTPSNSKPVIVSSTYYVGTTNQVVKFAISSTSPFNFGAFGQSSPGLDSIDGFAFDGQDLYASSAGASTVYQLAPGNLVTGWTANFGSRRVYPSGLPVARQINGLIDSDSSGGLRTLSATNLGTLVQLAKLSFTPLLGSDGRTYVGSEAGVVTAVNESPAAVAWEFMNVESNDFFAPLTMDCKGHLYAAAGDTVYAFITDAHGLRNTPWPKYQRDSRNTGNADRTASNGAPYGAFNATTSTCVQ